MTEPPGGPQVWIHEHAHPAVVAQLHFPPRVRQSPEQVERALRERAHGMELDLRYRVDPRAPGGGGVVCAHDRVRADSPPLPDLIATVLRHKGARTSVHADGLQFFLVLEPKTDDPRVFDGIYQALSAVRAELSTDARPGSGPRPLTAVLTGRHVAPCLQWLAGRYGADVDRLLVGEGVDYTGRIENLSPAGDLATFQWAALRSGHGLEGRVNALHRGQQGAAAGRFNVRAWGTGSAEELRRAVAAGADSVNCDPGDLATLRRLLAPRTPHGRDPWLALRGSRALVGWRDATGALSVASGTVGPAGLTLAREVCLSTFLQQRPRGRACAGALLPDGRFLVVHESRSGRRLGGVVGRFLSPDRFLAFDGTDLALTAPAGTAGDDARHDAGHEAGHETGHGEADRDGGAPGWRGAAPAAAVGADGTVLVVHQGVRTGELSCCVARRGGPGDPGGPDGALLRPHPLTRGEARRGRDPAAAIAATGEVVVVYEGTGGHRLWSVVGRLDDAGRVDGEEHPLTDDEGRPLRGRRPRVAFDPDGRVVVVHEGVRSGRPGSLVGRLVDGRIQGRADVLPEALAGASRPTVGFDDLGTAVVLYRDDVAGGALAYLVGRFDDGDGRFVGTRHPLVLG